MRVIVLSDTHCWHHEIEIPQRCSMIIHTGDFSHGSEESIDDFLEWYAGLKPKYKLLVLGNHDVWAESHIDEMKQKCHTLGIILLHDSSVTINGVKFYGTPYVPRFFDWAFMESDQALVARYAKIPKDTDVLLTHGPAQFILDEVPRGHVGSKALLDRLLEINVKYHIFGHIHECGGRMVKSKKWVAINASYLTNYHGGTSKVRVINIKGE